jgi:hypothetical protein
MPTAGSKLKYGHRNYIFDEKFWKKISEEKKIDLSYKQARAIIDKSNDVVADIVIGEQDGFKLPFGLGYIAATKFIPKNPAIDWKKTKELGKKVYFANLHTLGFSIRVIWYGFVKDGNKSTSFRNIYMFKTSEYLSKKLVKSFSSGKQYKEWTPEDFVNKGMLEKFYHKKIQKSKNIENGRD